MEYEEAFVKWMTGAIAAIGVGNAPTSMATADAAQLNGVEVGPGAIRLVETEATGAAVAAVSAARSDAYSKQCPFPARLIANRRLNGTGSAKDVRHFEIGLAGSGLTYEVGDALGVMPRNDPALVEELLMELGHPADSPVPGAAGGEVPFREALTAHYEITRIPKALLEVFATDTQDEHLRRAAAPEANGHLTEFLRGRDIVDLFRCDSKRRFGAAEFVRHLRKLQPRLYSISSSPKAHLDEVHLTVSAVRYESLGRQRFGVCSTFLADRVDAGTPVPVYVHKNLAFRLPAPHTGLIMIGPGTGIAPFRAFLEERQVMGATGRNWLFFGDQKSTADFLYREELEAFRQNGLLTRLDVAWSRDQNEKVYVQHRMQEQAREFFAWLEEGAAFYVCGDASRMAKDVDAALHQVIQEAGGKTPEQAAEYVRQLKGQKRYLRDVY